ncbi:MAG: VOC family protein [Xanthobacteraceae bacterium]
MTANLGFKPHSAHPDAVGVHSLDHFVLEVPDLAKAEWFYTDFGLDVEADGPSLSLRTAGNDQEWGEIIEGRRKRLNHISFGCFTEDFERLRQRATQAGIELLQPPPGFESNGFWMRDPAGLLIEVKVAPKSSVDHKAHGVWTSSPEGIAGAPIRADAPTVRPQRFSHMLVFATDIDRTIGFYSTHLGLRLSDRSTDVAFMHAIHGSDHHILAFAKSDAPGMHHCSWDMGGIDQVGLGAMQMAGKGHTQGWGLGRHVLGSNYFHYVRDPWGSYAEYSCDIDYIPATQDWKAGRHADEDSFYLWGPEPPPDFALNHEVS